MTTTTIRTWTGEPRQSDKSAQSGRLSRRHNKRFGYLLCLIVLSADVHALLATSGMYSEHAACSETPPKGSVQPVQYKQLRSLCYRLYKQKSSAGTA